VGPVSGDFQSRALKGMEELVGMLEAEQLTRVTVRTRARVQSRTLFRCCGHTRSLPSSSLLSALLTSIALQMAKENRELKKEVGKLKYRIDHLLRALAEAEARAPPIDYRAADQPPRLSDVHRIQTDPTVPVGTAAEHAKQNAFAHIKAKEPYKSKGV
jgi:hypothetical protein